MKRHAKPVFLVVVLLTFSVYSSLADKLLLRGDLSVEGTIEETNENGVFFTTSYGTQLYQNYIIKSIYVDEVEKAKRVRLPDSHAILAALDKEKWAGHPKQIPATVIDQGILKNVPYVSYRCGSNYEVNIYGDLDHPAGIDVGEYRELLSDNSAKKNCTSFISKILIHDEDKAVLSALRLTQDISSNNYLTFEITPPTAADAYGGWWVSVYSEAKLNKARASDDEMSKITLSKTVLNLVEGAGWTGDELKLARSNSPYPSTITFKDSSGQIVPNAQVVRVNEGVSLIWRDGVSGGVLKLVDLPEPLRSQFHYDAAKTAVAEDDEKRKKQEAAEYSAAMQRAAVAASTTTGDGDWFSMVDYSGGGASSSGGRVYVRGYTRANGTYVAPYTRSYPHHH